MSLQSVIEKLVLTVCPRAIANEDSVRLQVPKLRMPWVALVSLVLLSALAAQVFAKDPLWALLALSGTGNTAHSQAMSASPSGMASSAAETMTSKRKLLYYRNPMGLPDVSPTPKKDSMGMDYIPVYEGETPSDPVSVVLSPGRIQLAGVRTEVVEARVVDTPVRGFGVAQYNESGVQSISPGVESTVDEIYVRSVGERVQEGQPLLRLWATNPAALQLEIARRSGGKPMAQDPVTQSALTGAAPTNNRIGIWQSPASGVVIAKRAVAGQHLNATDEILRIADPKRMWVVADIAERDVGLVAVGQKASINVRQANPFDLEGTLTYVQPDIRPESRTARIVLEVPNPDERLKADDYVDVTIKTSAGTDPVVAVPDGAVISDGVRDHVLVAEGEGRFSVHDVKVGRRGAGYVEIVSGIAKGERVVTSANFLIDSEANIQSALAAFAAGAKAR